MSTGKHWLLAVAIGVLTIAGAEAIAAETIDQDRRLDKKITIEVAHTDLADLAKQITEQTGVAIKAGMNDKDWKPRERKVTIFAKDMPARDLLKQISQLLAYKLTASGKEKAWEYRIWQDRKSRLAEDDAVAAAEKAKAEEYRERHQAVFDAADEALGMTKTEAMAKRSSSPYLAYLGGTESGRALAAILSYVSKYRPDDRMSFVAGSDPSIAFEEFPPEIRQAIMLYIGSPAGRPGETFEVASVRLQPSYGEVGDHSSGGIYFVPRVWASANDSEAERSDSMEPQPIACALADPDSPWGERRGEEALANEYGEKIDDIGEDPGDSAEMASLFFSLESPTEKNPPTDPELTREIEIRPPIDEKERAYSVWCLGHKAGPAVREIARATGWSVFSESFDPLNDLGALLVYGKQPLYKVLVTLEKTGYTWERDGSIPRIHPIDSLVRRAREIPEALIADYRQRYQKRGRCTLEDVAELVSSLTDTQIVEGLFTHGLMGLDSQIVVKDSGSRDILRFYHSLPPLQKIALGSSSGLSLSEVAGPQWQSIRKAVPAKVPDATLAGGTVRLAATDYGECGFVVDGMQDSSQQPRNVWSCYLSNCPHTTSPERKNNDK